MKKQKSGPRRGQTAIETPARQPWKLWLIAGISLCAVGTVVWAITLFHKRAEKPGVAQPYIPRPLHTITFNKDIAPILFQRCATCHRPGQAGPFPLLTYADAKKRAGQIVQVTERRYMPPWLPEPGYGEFSGERRLSESELGLLRQWADEGVVEGLAADLPPPPQWPEDWNLGKPDLVLELPSSYTLPAEGKDVYRNFILPVSLDRKRFVRGFEFQPGNPKIVHHVFINVDNNRECRKMDGQDGSPGFSGMMLPEGVEIPEGHLLGWQPGRLPSLEPGGMAWTLPQNSDLILQMHLRPSGKPETLKVRLGLYLTDTPPTKSCFRLGLSSLMIDIPPGEQSYTVEDQFELPEDSQVLGVLPHAHYLCKRMEGFAILPDGTQKWLVLIKNWDFNWQGVYHYDKPMMLPKGTRLAMRFTYDNSTNNIQNPNTPPRRVRYGPQSSDEMGELWFQLLPLKPEGVGLLADAQAAKSRADVINYYEFVLQHDPNDVQAHTKLGFIRFLQGNSDEGIAHLRKAIALDPQADMPHYKLGLVFRNQNRFAEAKAEFEAALKLNPRNCDAHANVGVIYAAEGNLQLAEEHLRAAVNINPNDPNARALLSELLKAKANR